MRATWALFRANWITAMSYRMGTVFMVLSLIASLVPVYFVSHALQPLMASVIKGESDQYFSFLLVGMVVLGYVVVAINALPTAIQSTLVGGTLDMYLGMPTRPTAVFAGLTAYDYVMTTVRAILTLIFGWALGAHVVWGRLGFGFLIIVLIVLSYLPLALISAAMIVAFRTDGPMRNGLLVLSSLLGGAYYPTKVIPSWIQDVSRFVPLTYGLRSLRRVILEGAPLSAVAGDLGILLVLTAVLAAVAAVALRAAFRYARRAGTLAYY